jgi:hypothetical protein
MDTEKDSFEEGVLKGVLTHLRDGMATNERDLVKAKTGL